MPRYEFPSDLAPQDRSAVVVALDRVLGAARDRPSAWTLAGRAEALRMGALQVRGAAEGGWRFRGHVPFARRGTAPLTGRGDAK